MPRTSKASESDKAVDAEVQATRPERALYALLTAAAVSAPVVGEGKAKTNGGRWSLNAGSLMTTCVSGLNMQQDACGRYAAPIRLVVDLATAKFAKPVMPALGEHWWDKIIGNWSGGAIAAGGIEGDLTIYEARTPAEAAVLPECVRAKALLEQGHPWQASIGAYPEGGIDDYEEVPEGESVDVNGATFTADDADMPLYVMRNAVITEASICTFGADQNTGPLAAASARRRGQLAASAGTHTQTTKAKEVTAMSYKLAALLAAHPNHKALVAELVAAAQEKPEAERPTAEVLEASIDKAVAKAELAAKDAEIAALKEAAAKKPPVVIASTSTTRPPAFEGGNGAGEGDAPASLHQAMAQLHAENDKLKGFKLRAAALKRWPELRKTIPDACIAAGAR